MRTLCRYQFDRLPSPLGILGFLHHSHLGLKIKLSECSIGPGQVQKTKKAMSNCLFALGPYISRMTNVLLTDVGLNIPLGFIR